ncbi:zinc finger protein [Penicillium herquei]|nr:zinc finger protein [Penicillium herquei]
MDAQPNSEGDGSDARDEDFQDHLLKMIPSENEVSLVSVMGELYLERLTSLFADQSLQEQQEVHPSLWQDELGRLRVWASSIGINNPEKTSVKQRLGDALYIKDQTLQLLERLKGTADDLEEALQGSKYEDHIDDDSSDGSVEDETELQSIYRALRDTIDNLFQISMVIQTPAQHYRSPSTEISGFDVSSPSQLQHKISIRPREKGYTSYPKGPSLISTSELQSISKEDDNITQPDESSAARHESGPEQQHLNSIEGVSCSKAPDSEPQVGPMTLYDKGSIDPESWAQDDWAIKPQADGEVGAYGDDSIIMSLIRELDRIFSVDNLRQSVPLRDHMNEQGFVPLSVIASSKPIKSLTNDFDLIRYASRLLPSVEYDVGADGVELLRLRYMGHRRPHPYGLEDIFDLLEGPVITQEEQSIPPQSNLSLAREQLKTKGSFDNLPDFSDDQLSTGGAPTLSRELFYWRDPPSYEGSRQHGQVEVTNSRGRRQRNSSQYYSDLYTWRDDDIPEYSPESVHEDQIAGTEGSSAIVPLSSSATSDTADNFGGTNSHEDSGPGSNAQKLTLNLNGMTLSFADDALPGKSRAIRPSERGIMQPATSSLRNPHDPRRTYDEPLDIVRRQELDRHSSSSTASIYSGTSGSSRYSSSTASSRYSASSDGNRWRDLEHKGRDQNDQKYRRSRQTPGEAEKMHATSTEIRMPSKDHPRIHPVVDDDLKDLKRRSRRPEITGKLPPSSRPKIPKVKSEISRNTDRIPSGPRTIICKLSTHEQFVIDEFEKHVAHCTLCPHDLQNNDTITCVEGDACATRIASLLFSENGAWFSVNAHKNGEAGRVLMPRQAQYVRCLLEGIESGFFMRTSQGFKGKSST